MIYAKEIDNYLNDDVINSSTITCRVYKTCVLSQTKKSNSPPI